LPLADQLKHCKEAQEDRDDLEKTNAKVLALEKQVAEQAGKTASAQQDN
jgi:hypothetical protein